MPTTTTTTTEREKATWRIPFVRAVELAGLEDAEDLRVDLDEFRRVAGGLDRVDCIKLVVGRGDFEEVALLERDGVGKAGFRCEFARALDLVVVVVQPDNVGLAKQGNLARRAAHAAAHIQASLPFVQADLCLLFLFLFLCNIFYMHGKGWRDTIWARYISWRDKDCSKDSNLWRGAKWKLWPHPYS